MKKNNKKFNNNISWNKPEFKENISTICDFIFSRNDRKPSFDLPVQRADLNYFNKKGTNQLNATWLGHSSLLINIDGYKLITDPVFINRVSLMGPTRFNGNLPLEISQLEQIDAVLISHNHYDHLNKFSIKFLKNKVNVFITPLKVGKKLKQWGIAADKIVELNWWQDYKLNESIKITFLPTQHFSGRGIVDADKTLWGSYAINSDSHNIYFSGDSGYFEGFKNIGEKLGPFDITFMECGAYNKNWHHIHMYPEETLQAHLDLKGKILHPIHWGTFNLSLHAWDEPMERLSKAADLAGVKLALPIAGETTVYQEYIPEKKWWKE